MKDAASDRMWFFKQNQDDAQLKTMRQFNRCVSIELILLQTARYVTYIAVYISASFHNASDDNPRAHLIIIMTWLWRDTCTFKTGLANTTMRYLLARVKGDNLNIIGALYILRKQGEKKAETAWMLCY
jgi:hypothetical protein